MDLYSRYIIGYQASERLLCEQTTIPALKMAITNSNSSLKGLILHSDGGGQYFAKDFIELTKKHLIINSMSESVYENPNAERINGTIKNDYLISYKPDSFKEL